MRTLAFIAILFACGCSIDPLSCHTDTECYELCELLSLGGCE